MGDQTRVPVLEALERFRERGDTPFGPPGHRQGRGVDPRVLDVLGRDLFAADVLAMGGLDDRRMSQGVVTQAQELMAEAVRADQAFFSTCGSSLSVKTAMISVAGPGEKLLVSRNAHKSVVAGLILAGIVPVWVHPHFDQERELAHPPEPADFAAAFDAHPDAKGALLITPTDYGTCADIQGVAEVCHSHGVPLLVDEAWGAHLPFHPRLPAWGMDAGADLVVTSVHKMGAAVEQSSVFHVQGDRVSAEVLKQREDLLGTTSPSSLVYATLDGWRRHMVEHGYALLEDTIGLAEQTRERIDALPGLSVMGRETVAPGQAFDIDPLKLVIDVHELGVSGFQAAEWARAACHVDVASDQRRLTAEILIADDERTATRLVDMLTRLIDEHDRIESPPPVHVPPLGALELETVMRPRDAFFARAEHVKIEDAVGRVAAETVSPYPPGVPVLVPGERITAEVLTYLSSGPPAGMLLPDAADSSFETVRVVA
ncbi:aminotransferase class I/II-fold pyridoxal phosphate-dependent enzyme [Cryptosporangium sp. NPDC048952]|uniref:aminotransferase class I/II-fold pyridoxal phosphate-dependent enzyme n=1 Tax=Cryptosporangium sp. NPDC048952 TaxID=3363961 RepID=UPI003719EA73